jgi:hypothetical protein
MQAAPILRGSGSSLAGCGLLIIGLANCAFAESPVATSTGFTFNEISDTSLELREGDKRVFVYNHGDISLPSKPRIHAHSNYFHPVYGLDGEVLTDDFPADHFHHRGLYWAWPHVRIGDREYDLWSYRGIRYKLIRWLSKEAGPRGARLGIENGWFVGDKQVMKEEAWLDVHPASDTGRNIDVALTWTPIDEPITLLGAEGKSYGGLVFRFAPRVNTIITAPSGRTSADLVVTRLPWANLSAQFRGAPRPGGAAVFVHPSHPDFPPEWMTRSYGVLAVGWPGVKLKTLPAGKPVTCRYRVWVHRGVPDVVALQQQYESFAAERAE